MITFIKKILEFIFIEPTDITTNEYDYNSIRDSEVSRRREMKYFGPSFYY